MDNTKPSTETFLETVKKEIEVDPKNYTTPLVKIFIQGDIQKKVKMFTRI